MILMHYTVKLNHIEDKFQRKLKMQYVNMVRSSLSTTQKAISNVRTSNQQNKCPEPSKNHQELNKIKHRKQLKTYLVVLAAIAWLPTIILLPKSFESREFQFIFFSTKAILSPSLSQSFFYVYISLTKTQSVGGKSSFFFPLPSFFLFFFWKVYYPHLCRISVFHMYVATLIPFSLQKYFSYLL